jgi:hypothetical protein
MRILERIRERVQRAAKEARDVRTQLQAGGDPGRVIEDSVKRAFGK